MLGDAVEEAGGRLRVAVHPTRTEMTGAVEDMNVEPDGSFMSSYGSGKALHCVCAVRAAADNC
ncbi:hypothetical protein GCM10010270_32160 [Streptomyces violaceus]|nr:hypothetical protein GCM10010270_32160 [Streptomyces janthinus]